MKQKVEIKIENGKVVTQLDLYETINNLTDEARHELVRALTCDRVMEEAAKRMAGDSDMWASGDTKVALKFLSSVENHLLSGYKWGILQNLEQLAKNMITQEHLYWKMRNDPVHNEFFRQWLEDNNIKSNYTPEFKGVKEFKEYVGKILESFVHGDDET